MKYVTWIFLCLFSTSVFATEAIYFPQSNNLAKILAFSNQLSSTADQENMKDFSLAVRVFAGPMELLECGSAVESCPDHRLFITVSTGDLGETPALYELTESKGWEFVKWHPPVKDSGSVIFTVRTTLAYTNLEDEERAKWQAKEYIIEVTETGATYRLLNTK